MDKKKRKQQKPQEKKRENFNIMWIIVALIFGFALADFFDNHLPIIIFLIIGIIAFIIFKQTPSSKLKWNKNEIQSIIVWTVIIIALFIIMINYFSPFIL